MTIRVADTAVHMQCFYKSDGIGQRRDERREILGCSRPGDGLCPLERFLELARARVPGDLDMACAAKVGGAKVSDDSPEACKEALLTGTQSWGKGRHTGEMWLKRG